MTTQYNPDECARLIAEARADDARMTPGPWRPGAHERDAVYCALGAHMYTERVLLRVNSRSDQYRDVDAESIARTRNNLRAMADQFEAAQAEIERLKRDVVTVCNNFKLEAARPVVEAFDDVKIATLRRAVQRLEDWGSPAEHAALRSVVAAVDAYRAARGKAGSAAEQPRPDRYTHLAVIVREGEPEVRGFHDKHAALAWADDAGAQWSETFVAEIIKGPIA